MSISAALQSAVSGLSANARMLDVVSGNLANQLTEGYAARNVTLGAPAGATGSGVRVLSVDRATDHELTAIRRRADAELAQGSVLAEATARIAAALGETGEPGSLFDRFRRFEAALTTLADTPESGPRQLAAAEAAADLARGFNLLSAETSRLRADADQSIAREVDAVNAALTEVGRLNRQVQVFRATGRDTTALEDQRERAIDRVSAAIPLRETRLDDGRIELRTEQGLTLVGRSARQLEFTRTPLMTPQMSYDAGTGALSGLRLEGVDIAPGSGRAQALSGGGLAGLFAVRDEVTPAFQGRIDAMAADLVERGGPAADDPTLATGDPGLFTDGGASFDPADRAGLAGRLALNAVVDPSAGGNPALLRDGLGATGAGPAGSDTLLRSYLAAFGATTDASGVPGLSGTLDFEGRIAGVMEIVSTERVGREADSSLLSAARAGLAAEEGRVRAVDADAELQRLIRLEQAYAANAQVIQAASRMLDQLTGI